MAVKHQLYEFSAALPDLLTSVCRDYFGATSYKTSNNSRIIIRKSLKSACQTKITKYFKQIFLLFLSMQLKVRKNELFECLAVGDSGEDVLHSVGSLGENVGEVLLGEGAVAAVSSDEGSEGGSDLVVELAEVLLVEDEGFIGLLIA